PPSRDEERETSSRLAILTRRLVSARRCYPCSTASWREFAMQLTLYYAPTTCALVPFVTLTEAGATFEVRNVNTRKGETRTPQYRSLNPKGKVPVLMIDGE